MTHIANMSKIVKATRRAREYPVGNLIVLLGIMNVFIVVRLINSCRIPVVDATLCGRQKGWEKTRFFPALPSILPSFQGGQARKYCSYRKPQVLINP